MKKITIVLTLFLSFYVRLPAFAGIFNVQMLFTMPSSVDPEPLTIHSTNTTYTKDDNSINITGATFLPKTAAAPDLTGLGGLDVYGDVTHSPQQTFPDPVEEIKLTTSYLGSINFTSVANFGKTPWQFIDQSTPTEHIFLFRQTPSSGTLNLNSFFGEFTAMSDDPTFAAAPFTVTGFTSLQPVPELSTSIAFGGLAILGAFSPCDDTGESSTLDCG